MKYYLSFLSILLVTIAFSITTLAQGAGKIDADGGSKVIRIGVLLPKVQLTDAKGEIAPEEALRNSYAVLLNSDYFEVVALDARLTSLALAEAKDKECDYILNVDLEQIEKKSGGGLFGKVLRDTGNRATYETSTKVPYGGGTGERIAGTTARSAIRNTGYNMSNMAVQVKKNDKFTLDYNLTTVDGDAFYSKQIEEKAKKNNDDVLARMLEASGEDIVQVLMKKLPQ